MSERSVDPLLRSWVPVRGASDFPIQNLPFGVFRTGDGPARIGVAIGEHILDLVAVHDAGVMRLTPHEARAASLNPLLETRGRLRDVRRRVSELLTADNDELAGIPDRGLVHQGEVTMLLPVEVADYVDFYSSEQHATNLGRMFRPDAEPLLPNWKHLPIGYHGRSSTVVVSGTNVVRPSGQRKPPVGAPTFGPSARLDIELEVGFVTGPGASMGGPLPIAAAESHIGGLVLVNDWSARDLQAWEYVPLGPFLGKSFATTVSPWLVTLDALAPYRVAAPVQDPAPLPYLADEPRLGVGISLEVELNGTVVSRTSFADMYWTMAQQLAHVASNGTRIRTGDLYASGTVSGSEPGTYGSLIELSANGTSPIQLDGATRTFLEDGDTVVMRGWCDNGVVRIGFGECAGTIVPATATKG